MLPSAWAAAFFFPRPRGWDEQLKVCFATNPAEMVANTDLPAPWNVIAVWGVAIPTVALLTNRITDLGIQDFTILKASESP